MPSLLIDDSPGDYRFDLHHGNTIKIANLFSKSLHFDRYSPKLLNCSNFLRFSLQDGKYKLYDARFCRNRFCPLCSWRKGLLWKAKLLSILPDLMQTHTLRFVTLTLANCHYLEFDSTLKHMQQSWRRFSRPYDSKKCIGNRNWHYDGFLKSMEVTVEKNRPDYLHPHYHVVLSSPKSSKKGFYDQKKLCKDWGNALQINYTPSTWIEKTSSSPGLVAEITKYIHKSKDILNLNPNYNNSHPPISQLDAYISSMYGKRFIETGGIFRDLLKGFNEDESDLIHVDEEAINDGEKCEFICYQWQNIFHNEKPIYAYARSFVD